MDVEEPQPHEEIPPARRVTDHPRRRRRDDRSNWTPVIMIVFIALAAAVLAAALLGGKVNHGNESTKRSVTRTVDERLSGVVHLQCLGRAEGRVQYKRRSAIDAKYLSLAAAAWRGENNDPLADALQEAAVEATKAAQLPEIKCQNVR